MENAGYLLAAFSIIWVLVFAYIFYLLKKQAGIKRQIDSIQEALKDKQNEA